MPSCQAINCTNARGKCEKSFFEIPDPKKSAEKRKQCKLWIHHLRNGKLKFETFVWSKNKIVCEDHFEEDAFEKNLIAESLGFKCVKKTLKFGALPTIVKQGPGVQPDPKSKGRPSTVKLLAKRKRAQLRDCVSAFVIKDEDIAGITQSKSAERKRKSENIREPKAKKVCTATVDSHVNDECLDFHKALADSRHSTDKPDVLPCGHPCEICVKLNGNRVLANDHTYFKNDDEAKRPYKKSGDTESVFSSTPMKTFENFEESVYSPILKTVDYSISEESSKSLTLKDDSKDPDFSDPDLTTDESDVEETTVTCTQEQIYIKEKKFVVFESSIETLINKLKCNVCDCPVDPDSTMKDLSDGMVVTYTVHCTGGHLIIKWSSQPYIGKMPVGNLLASTAILCCGQTYSHISQFAEFCNLKFFSHTTFNKIQRQYIMPVVTHTWKKLQEMELKKIKQQNKYLRLAGDGRCDSPGFNAKYCTYSLLDLETQHILMFVIVKVSETTSSSKMEVEGFRKCMNYLLDLGFRIEILATDRHVQIRSIMTKEYTNVQHQFDVWHLCKSMKKKLTAKAKLKGCEELQFWIKSICNHLWWCANNCNGDKDLLEESWKSILQHVANVHTFEGKLFTACKHDTLDPETAERKRWLMKNSKAHNALKEVILDKRLCKDIRQLSEFCHTGSLEVFHSLLLKYAPKRQEFDADQMYTRTALAVIDHNLNQNRGQKVTNDGEKMYKIVLPKATAHWVAKPVHNDKSYRWVSAIMQLVLMQKISPVLPVKERSKEGNIAPVPAPSKLELIQNLFSRFEKC